MLGRNEPRSGFSVLDGAALVMGAAVASILIREVIRDGDRLAGPGWLLIWGAFAWVALTAAGPFLFLARRFLRRHAGYPQVGDALWAVLGLPWILTAAIGSAAPGRPRHQHRDDLTALCLSVGLPLACLIALAVVWKRWVMVSPEEAARTASAPWTNRIGLALAVAWPIQCGLGLVISGGS